MLSVSKILKMYFTNSDQVLIRSGHTLNTLHLIAPFVSHVILPSNCLIIHLILHPSLQSVILQVPDLKPGCCINSHKLTVNNDCVTVMCLLPCRRSWRRCGKNYKKSRRKLLEVRLYQSRKHHNST